MTRRALLWTTMFVAGTGIWVAAQTSRAAAPQDDTCTLSAGGDFSPGWVERRDGSHYRCVAILDKNLKPAGAAWVKVESNGGLPR